MPYTRIQTRRGTTSEWTTSNPTLAIGEIGLELDTKRLKIGDGSSAWNELDYGLENAYEIAVKNGFSGTEVQWLASLKGDPGATGLNWQGTWDSATDYVNNDAVYHEGASWFASGDPLVGENPSLEAEHWYPLALQGATGDIGPTGPEGPAAEVPITLDSANNVFIGEGTSSPNGGSHNFVAGSFARIFGTTGTDNVAIGREAINIGGSSSNNVAIGPYALHDQGSGGGNSNIAIGLSSLSTNTTGSRNIAIGIEAMTGSQSGNYNVAIGDAALRNTTTASDNVAIGRWSQLHSKTGGNNITMGYRSLASNESGANNVVIGAWAADSFDGLDNSVVIGYAASSSLNSLNNAGTNNIIIGSGAGASSTSVSNEITLGNSSITNLRCNDTSISGLSDVRDKKNIEPIGVGLDFVNKLNPVKFTWDQRDGGRVNVEDSGFIAQELMAVEDEYSANDWLRLTSRNDEDRYEAAPARLVPILVKAIQDLSARIEGLEQRLSGSQL